MQTWVIYGVLSMMFEGVTAVLTNIDFKTSTLIWIGNMDSNNIRELHWPYVLLHLIKHSVTDATNN